MDRAGPPGRVSVPHAGSIARRLFARELPAPGVELTLDAEAAQHARVLRVADGDDVCLFDGRGQSVLAKVVQSAKGVLRCVASEPWRMAPRGPRVVLVQCLPKAGKLDDIVRMTTELGVSEIALAVSEYCVARPAREEHKLERLERIASEALRQSEGAYLPQILAPRPLAEVLARAPASAYRAVCLERSSEPLPAQLQGDELWLAIGPEGGFSPTDRDSFARAGFVSSALGRSILRTETAAVVGVALALERFERSR